jgi:hypothetical protein
LLQKLAHDWQNWCPCTSPCRYRIALKSHEFIICPIFVDRRLLFLGQNLRECSENITRVRSGFMIATLFCWIWTRICQNTIVWNDMNVIDLDLSDENWDIYEYHVTLFTDLSPTKPYRLFASSHIYRVFSL